MKNFYYTFGSDPQYPFGKNDYVVVEAVDIRMANAMFMRKHPGPHEDIVNCAFFYTEEKFNAFRDKYYADVQPIEVIRIENATDLEGLDIVHQLDWFAEVLTNVCDIKPCSEADKAEVMRSAAKEIRRLREI